MVQHFIPFAEYFVQNPAGNPYDHFLSLGLVKAFPYPPMMLYLFSAPFFLSSLALAGGAGAASLFLARLPLLAADLAIFWILCKLFEGKEKQVNMLYWASPVVFYINYVHGQLDAIPIALLVLSIYYLFSKRTVLSFALLAVGLATKSHLFVVVPIYLFYLMKEKTPWQKTALLFLGLATGYLLMVSPYLLSPGFAQLVLKASEQLRIFNLAVWFAPALAFFVVPAFFLYIMFKTYSFKRINRDAFFLMVGLIFTMLVTLIAPEQGWYLWSIPFIAYFFIKEEDLGRTIYHAFGIAYLAYFAIIPSSDIFRVFQASAPGIASLPNPYAVLSGFTSHADLAVGLAFTALTATLIYLYYTIYKHGIRSTLRFQEKNGTPAIGIAGDSGAGKTTLAMQLARMFGEHRANVIFGDDVHKWERGHPSWKTYTHLNPVANYINYNYDQIRNLKKGKAILRPMYDHSTGRFTAPKKIEPRDIIISEGLHTFFIPEASSVYELKVYLDPDERLRMRWKTERDVKGRNYTARKVAEQIERRKEDSEKFVQRQKERADIIVSFSMKGGAQALSLFIRTSFAAEAFVDALMACPTLKVRHEYASTEFQRIDVEGTASPSDIMSALARAGISPDDYKLEKGGVFAGQNGAVQAAVIYCLNEKLKALSVGE
jgi:uridine kinase